MLSVEDGDSIQVKKVVDRRYVERGMTVTLAVRLEKLEGKTTVTLRTRNLVVLRLFTREGEIPFEKAGEFTLVEVLPEDSSVEFGLESRVKGPGAAFGGKVLSGGKEVAHRNLRLVVLKEPEKTVDSLLEGKADTLEEAIVLEERRLLALEILQDIEEMDENEMEEKRSEVERRLSELRCDLLNLEFSEGVAGKRLLSPTGKRLSLQRKPQSVKRGEAWRKERLKKLLG